MAYFLRDFARLRPGRELKAHIILRHAQPGQLPVSVCGARVNPRRWAIVEALPEAARLCWKCRKFSD